MSRERTHIEQALSSLDSRLRQELASLLQLQEQSSELTHKTLSELIELLLTLQLSHHDLYARLARLDAALCQLELGLYGLCADCEAEIEAERLGADPTEQRCERCNARYQQQHRQELRLDH
ncbi:TraR/DksA C4-type zinc finger protein [Shewanella sp. AS16]|uniref:TraR/DksA family transcriptional regulator n=1 Tax=Shewanella sp. AS16 TaxID=2907625 RepID=UPI001F360ACE|nr:TraR/DksA C4-type zinc finger protein [Shewanella sp. AS16]MCE9684914.1 TraR/DksA C4-type zinc finger protein [Shewanella sp. AS16]